MRRMRLDEISCGRVLARNVFDDRGKIILAKGAVIKQNYKDRLKEIGITSLYVEDPLTDNIEIRETISEETRVKTVCDMNKALNLFKSSDTLPMDLVSSSVNALIDDILNQRDVVLNVEDIRTRDSHLYSHCVSVCTICSVIGVKRGYNYEMLKNLATGAILHDLGKVFLPYKGYYNDDSIDEELVKSHVYVGYNKIKECYGISHYSRVAVLMHHECYDGSGYPMGLKGDEIHPFAALVSICDVIDRLINPIDISNKMPVHLAVEYIRSKAWNLFDGELVKEVLPLITPYPQGTGVLLSNGQRGVVFSQNRSFPERPIIKTLDGTNIDMSVNLTLFIDEVS